MKLIIYFIMLIYLCALGDVKYKEAWSVGSVTINYGKPLDNTSVFPYHPSREEIKKAVLGAGKIDFKVKVMDEDGRPIKQARVDAFLKINGFGASGFKYNEKHELTNEDGIAEIKGACDGNVLFYVRKAGWHSSCRTEFCFIDMNNFSLHDGKWQPYGMTHEIILRPIQNPIPMIRPHGLDLAHVFPKTGDSIGLDLFACDWVGPSRKGETVDVIFTYRKEENSKGYRETLTLTFPNKGDGVYRLPCRKWSTFQTEYHASTDSNLYQDHLAFHREIAYKASSSGWTPNGRSEVIVAKNDLGIDDYLILRTRTQLDENGQVVSCHYSKTTTAIDLLKGRFRIGWLTNPTPNDTNLEEDPNRRLDLSDLKEMERIRIEKARREEAVSNVVSGFVAAVKAGRRDEAMSFCFNRTQLAMQDITQWLDRNIPLFAGGEMDVEAEPRQFIAEESAIVPVRYWRPDAPEMFDIRPVCMYVTDIDKWLLLPDFENWKNKHFILTTGMVMDFERLTPLFEEYRRERMNLPKPPPPAADPDAEPRRKAEEARKAAEKEAERKAAVDPPEGAAVTKTLSDFLDALKAGRREEALSFWMPADAGQKERIGLWLDKALPFFKTDEVELVAAGKVFAKDGVAITAIRKWRKADPEIYGIEIACMVRRDGKWRLITNFEDFRDRINKLDNDTLNVFNKLEQYYWDYKREHVEIVRKRKNARFY